MIGASNPQQDKTGTTGAVILAAGAGSRLGHRPKCLLQLDGIALIHRQIKAISTLELTEIVVVLGHHGHLISPALLNQPVTTVHQLEDQHHQSDSVRLGVSKLSPHVKNVLVCPSDLPLLNSKDYQAVLDVFRARGPSIHFVGPEVGGVPGHPVIFDSQVIHQITSGDQTFGSGAWRTANHAHSSRWQTANDHFIRDIDSEDDRIQFELETQRKLQWAADVS
ncbi:MAG: nucleotidyltransferase family protein [Luminiphilus sp.]|nr:nucleotidyltransferase family protein [Luminiphilus sp.]